MRRRMALLIVLLMLGLTSAAQGEGLSMLALNVGKADCILLMSGQSVYMIDTGRADDWGSISAALRSRGITRLDGVLLTHTDDDHAGGAAVLASSSIEVGGWYAPAYFTGVKAKKHPAVKAAALRGEEVIWLKGGDELPLDGGSLKVIGPIVQNDKKDNNNSLILRAETADGSILLCGDMEFDEEYTLLKAGLLTEALVLKVPDHAEEHATSQALAAAVSPKLAVISTDSAEEPDTPSVRVMQVLRAVGADIAVTQNAEEGVFVELKGGEVFCTLTKKNGPQETQGIVIADLSVAQDIICIGNTGDDEADLSGWYLYSDRGGETFILPEGTTLKSGAQLSISALDSEDAGDLVWPEKKVWHPTREDTAYLFDAYGRLMDTW